MRFSVPEFTEEPRDNWPPSFCEEPEQLRDAFNASTSVQVYQMPTQLHVIQNKDLDTSISRWEVACLMRTSLEDGAIRCTSITDVRPNDTPDSVGAEYATTLVTHFVRFLMNEMEDGDEQAK